MTMKRAIVLDFETASFCDLTTAGAWRYAEDPTTEVLCLCWSFLGAEQQFSWRPGEAANDAICSMPQFPGKHHRC